MESINLESFIGTTLVAKDPCYMDGYSNQHPTLTVGKEYEIVDYRGDNDIVIVDDDGDNHLFEVNPDGSFKSWKCNVTGKTVIPFLYLFNAEPKQETLEKAAGDYANKELNNDLTSKVGNFYGFSSSFIEGAKWQAERMYSEEDMIEFNEWVSLNFPNQHNYLRALQKCNQGLYIPEEKLKGYYSTKELLEKFKKK